MCDFLGFPNFGFVKNPGTKNSGLLQLLYLLASNQLMMTHCTVGAAFVQSSLRPWGPQTSGFGLLSIPHLWELSHPCPSFSWDVFGELLATPFQWNMASICCTRDPGNMRKKYPPFPISFLLAPAFPKLYKALSVMFVAKWESSQEHKYRVGVGVKGSWGKREE